MQRDLFDPDPPHQRHSATSRAAAEAIALYRNGEVFKSRGIRQEKDQ